MLGRWWSTNLVMLLVAYVGFGEWWKAWRHWERGWTTVPVVLHGAGEWACTNSQRSRICAFGNWVSFVVSVLYLRRRPNECCADHMKRTGVIVVRQFKHNQPRVQTIGFETRAYCCMANDKLSEWCEGSQMFGKICDMALRRIVERWIHQIVQGGLS